MTAIVYKTAHGTKVKPAIQPHGSEAVTVRFEFTTTAKMLTTDVVHMGWIPANCRVTDWALDVDDISDTAAGTMSLGILVASTGLTVDTTASGGAAWVATDSIGQAVGYLRPVIVNHTRMVVSRTADQLVGIVVGTSYTATTASDVIGKIIGLTLTYIAA